jgi:hypothetical protein
VFGVLGAHIERGVSMKLDWIAAHMDTKRMCGCHCKSVNDGGCRMAAMRPAICMSTSFMRSMVNELSTSAQEEDGLRKSRMRMKRIDEPASVDIVRRHIRETIPEGVAWDLLRGCNAQEMKSITF